MGSGVMRIALLLVVMVVVAGCPNEPEGRDLNVMNSHISFLSGGGTDTAYIAEDEVAVRTWWIANVDYSYVKVGGTIRGYGGRLSSLNDGKTFIRDTSFEFTEDINVFRDGVVVGRYKPGFKAYVPEMEPRSLVVECEPNPSDTLSRMIRILMISDDDSTAEVYVWQNSIEGEKKGERDPRFFSNK